MKAGIKKSFSTTIIFCGFLTTVHFVFAQTWTQVAPTTNTPWSSIACSADGSKLIAVAGETTLTPFPVYASTNYGATWIQTSAPSREWSQVAASADFTKLIAIDVVGDVYISTNSGESWISNSISPLGNGLISSDARKLAYSANGSKIFVAATDTSLPSGPIYASIDSGATWTSNAILDTYGSVASSADGTKLAAISYDGQLCTSTNSGATWITNNTSLLPTTWYSIASSADGSKLAAVHGIGGIYISTNSGATWVSHSAATGPTWKYVAMSADGSRLIVAAQNVGYYPGSIYTSSNSGLTWVSNNVPAALWQGVAVSADGNEFVAVSEADSLASRIGRIWVSKLTPSPQLSANLINTNLLLSWLVPSTNFVLQQSSNLTAANWVALTNVPALNLTNLHDEVWLSPTNASSFFRLVAQ